MTDEQMDITPAPEFMLEWCRQQFNTTEKRKLPTEEFFKGCATDEEKHARVAQAYPSAYRRKAKRREC